MRQRRRVWRPKEGADLRCVRVADRRLHRSPTQLAFIWPAAAKSRHTAHLSHVDTWASTLHRAVRKRTPEAEEGADLVASGGEIGQLSRFLFGIYSIRGALIIIRNPPARADGAPFRPKRKDANWQRSSCTQLMT